MERYFSYTFNSLVLHETAEEARQTAEEDLQWQRDRADDGWDDEVELICWGEVRQQVTMISTQPTPNGRFDSLDEYGLVDPANPPELIHVPEETE